MAVIFIIPAWTWIIVGFLLSLIPKRPIKISSASMQQVFFTFSFAFILLNIALSFILAAIAKGSMSMTSDSLLQMAQIFLILAMLVFGFLIGEIVLAIREGKKNKQQDDKQKTESSNLEDIATGVMLIIKAISNMTRERKGKGD